MTFIDWSTCSIGSWPVTTSKASITPASAATTVHAQQRRDRARLAGTMSGSPAGSSSARASSSRTTSSYGTAFLGRLAGLPPSESMARARPGRRGGRDRLSLSRMPRIRCSICDSCISGSCCSAGFLCAPLYHEWREVPLPGSCALDSVLLSHLRCHRAARRPHYGPFGLLRSARRLRPGQKILTFAFYSVGWRRK